MCGIAGRIGNSKGSIDALLLMLDAMKHRGPDDIGFFVSRGLEIGMTRLAINAIQTGQQPVSDSIRNLHLVFNGEIYNFSELETYLRRNSVYLEKKSEAELLLKLYQKDGIEFVNKISGMFAIAIWDGGAEKLILIRDRFGKKPIFYRSTSDGGLDFASEIKAFKAIVKGSANWDPNFESINSVLTLGYIPSPNSAFMGIHSLEPGSILTWHKDKIALLKYWEPPIFNEEDWSIQQAIEIISGEIERATSIRLQSQRPIGTFLSGGIDSTIVTAMAAKHKTDIKTFSIGFENSKFDESSWARKVANFLGTDHHEIILSADPVSMIENLSNSFDQPFADSSAIPTFEISKVASSHVTVVLTGDGGDEVFGGYTRYKIIPLIQKYQKIISPFSRNITASSHLLNKFDIHLLDKISRASQVNGDLPSSYLNIMTLVNQEDRNRLLTKEFKNLLTALTNPETAFFDYFENANSRKMSQFEQMTRYDMMNYLPGDLLVKVDIATMANSLEARSPLLDTNLLEIAAKVPQKFRIHQGQTKFLLREIARNLVPASLIDRPKMGFAIPRAEWLRGPMKEIMMDTLTDSTFKERNWFNSGEVKKIIDSHLSGKNEDKILWPVLMIENWARTWL